MTKEETDRADDEALQLKAQTSLELSLERARRDLGNTRIQYLLLATIGPSTIAASTLLFINSASSGTVRVAAVTLAGTFQLAALVGVFSRRRKLQEQVEKLSFDLRHQFGVKATALSGDVPQLSGPVLLLIGTSVAASLALVMWIVVSSSLLMNHIGSSDSPPDAKTASPTPDASPSSDASSTVPVERCPTGTALVEAGKFRPQLQPTIEISVAPGFCIDKTEVTAADYQACVDAGSCASRIGLNWPTPGGVPVAPSDKATDRACNGGKPDRQQHPMNCVSYRDANNYCSFVHGNLPSDLEWEWVARSTDKGWLYPWGNLPPFRDEIPERLCWSERPVGRLTTCPVGSFPAGDSALGVHDLAGNVREWTATAAPAIAPQNNDASTDAAPGQDSGGEERLIIVRSSRYGGTDPRAATAGAWWVEGEYNRAPDIGFRCIHRKPPPQTSK